MTETETLALARSLGVNLDVDAERGIILATPKDKVTDDLRAGIRENSEGLRRTLLYYRAALHFVGAVAEAGVEPVQAFEKMNQQADELNRAWCDGNWEEFKTALREWTRAGLKAIHEKRPA